jgi:uncharacterized protein YegJ (DUF2314 family)
MKLRHVLLLLSLVGCSAKNANRDNERVEPSTTPVAKADPAPPAASGPLPDRPVEMSPERVRRVAELTQQARKTYPDAKRRFLAGLPAGERFYMTATLRSPGAWENAFITVTSIANGQVKGTIASELVGVKGIKTGDAYTFAEADMVDWTIAKDDGSEEGNIVGKYLDTTH